jgi:hypothetical protein
MLKRLSPTVLALLLLSAALPAAATNYTDIWYLPAEHGWGVNMVQSDNFIFATFFVYGSTDQPTWYTAQMFSDANGNFAGTLYATQGSYLGAPWDPNALLVSAAGTASFVPGSPYVGTLTYTINGGPTVVKTIQRQVLTTITIGGNYNGGWVGIFANAGNNTCNQPGEFTDTFTLGITQPGDGTATLAINYTSNLSCTFSGTLVQYGQLYSIPNASYQCSDGLSTSARVDQLRATATGVEGTYSAPSVGGGCSENASFAGVLF